MTTQAKAWKFWTRSYQTLFCFIVTIEDRKEAEAFLRAREPVGTLLDTEPLPDRLFQALDIKPGEIIGFKMLNERR